MRFFLLLFVLLLGSCAQSIHINYSYDTSTPSGSLVVIPDKPLDKVYFTMDKKLLVEKKNVKRIQVDGIPQGEHLIQMTSDAWYYSTALDYQSAVQIADGQTTTELVDTPPYSSGYYAYLNQTLIFCQRLSTSAEDVDKILSTCP